MKWVTKNYRGQEQVWYSADLINQIKEICERYSSKKCVSKECSLGQVIVANHILHLIETEEKEKENV